jgi:hypothetical protein
MEAVCFCETLVNTEDGDNIFLRNVGEHWRWRQYVSVKRWWILKMETIYFSETLVNTEDGGNMLLRNIGEYWKWRQYFSPKRWWTLKMEAKCFSETLVNTEDAGNMLLKNIGVHMTSQPRRLHIHCRENIKSFVSNMNARRDCERQNIFHVLFLSYL